MQPINCLTNQSIDVSFSHQSLTKSKSIDQKYNQLIYLFTNQSINKSTNQLIFLLPNQSLNALINESINQEINQYI